MTGRFIGGFPLSRDGDMVVVPELLQDGDRNARFILIKKNFPPAAGCVKTKCLWITWKLGKDAEDAVFR